MYNVHTYAKIVSLVQNLEFVVVSCEAEITESVFVVGINEIILASKMYVEFSESIFHSWML